MPHLPPAPMARRRTLLASSSRLSCRLIILCGILLELLHLNLVSAPESFPGEFIRTSNKEDRQFLLKHEPVRRLQELGTVSDSSEFLERTFLSPAALRAGKLIQEWMLDAGLNTWIDDVGNVHGRSNCGNASAPALLLGSHLDTVIDAGRYDGALGIVCAIAAVKALHENGELYRYPRPIEIIAFSDEEGVRFQSTFLGSNAVAGTFKQELLYVQDKRGLRLGQALKEASLPGTEESISNLKYSSDLVWGYIEVHIEQGPILEALGLPLGIVEAISGQTRLNVKVKGRQGHAGTVPMTMRRDPMPAAARAIVDIEQICQGSSLVCTVGEISTWPGASNVIPGEVTFTVDIRAKDDAIWKHAALEIERTINGICDDRFLSCDIQRKHEAGAIRSSEYLVKRLQAAASSALEELSGCGSRLCQRSLPLLPLLSSGAGHDAMALASLTKVAMLFVRCEGGISHSPAENVLEDDIWTASMALYAFLYADIRAGGS